MTEVEKFIKKIQKSDVEKAIEYFNRRLFDAHGYPIDKEHTETAVKALYKANKLSPISYDKHYYKCPCCKEDLGIDDDCLFVYKETPPNFCEKCGQALDWSETETETLVLADLQHRDCKFSKSLLEGHPLDAITRTTIKGE